MKDLADFLGARWDELGADAGHVHYWSCDNAAVAGWHRCNCPAPNYLRADIAAKRKILDDLAITVDGQRNVFVCDGICECGDGGQPVGHCRTVRLLAAPFRAHPDFDPAWAVE